MPGFQNRIQFNLFFGFETAEQICWPRWFPWICGNGWKNTAISAPPRNAWCYCFSHALLLVEPNTTKLTNPCEKHLKIVQKLMINSALNTLNGEKVIPGVDWFEWLGDCFVNNMAEDTCNYLQRFYQVSWQAAMKKSNYVIRAPIRKTKPYGSKLSLALSTMNNSNGKDLNLNTFEIRLIVIDPWRSNSGDGHWDLRWNRFTNLVQEDTVVWTFA